jgi:hypothetical protein
MKLGVRFDVYLNTPRNVERLGMLSFPEYVWGDLRSPYIVHDSEKGEFAYAGEDFFDGLPAPAVWMDNTKRQMEEMNIDHWYDWVA